MALINEYRARKKPSGTSRRLKSRQDIKAERTGIRRSCCTADGHLPEVRLTFTVGRQSRRKAPRRRSTLLKRACLSQAVPRTGEVVNGATQDFERWKPVIPGRELGHPVIHSRFHGDAGPVLAFSFSLRVVMFLCLRPQSSNSVPAQFVIARYKLPQQC